MTSKLNVGDAAPRFKLHSDGGRVIDLDAMTGRKVVLYFYPKADTPGCTKEAMEFNALRSEFDAANTQVVGVSADPVKALDKFKGKYGLTFDLATDEDKGLLEAYGVWVEKSMYGKKYMGIERATVLIGTDGRILEIWPKVKIDGHASEVLAAARAAG